MTYPQHNHPDLSLIAIERVKTYVLRCPIAMPVQTSFGYMHDRPALFVEVIARDGASGCGEVWCNFPSCGAEHRPALVQTVFAPLLEGQHVEHPAAMFEHLTQRTAVLALQSREYGPIARTIAGIDLALWDLQARRAGLPLWRLLGGTRDEIGVYASGLNPTGTELIVADRLARGFDAFRLKVGFGRQRDADNLKVLREILGPEGLLMVDANQAWDLDTALSMAEVLGGYGPEWLEEPLRCDRPIAEWQTLSARIATPLAARENFSSDTVFEDGIASGARGVIQPDAATWGGISGNWPVAQAVQAVDSRIARITLAREWACSRQGIYSLPRAIAADRGLLEVDANPDPLRSLLSGRSKHLSADACVLARRRALALHLISRHCAARLRLPVTGPYTGLLTSTHMKIQ